MTKIPIEELYDGELLQSISDMQGIIDTMHRQIHKRVVYEHWPEELQLAEEFIFITDNYKKHDEGLDV